jgi:20S proteasome subunit beta 4
MRNATHLGPDAVANFVRGEVAKALRSKRPYNVNLLLGGVDPITEKPSLYWCDYLAALAKLPYAAHGYAQYVHHLIPSHDIGGARNFDQSLLRKLPGFC